MAKLIGILMILLLPVISLAQVDDKLQDIIEKYLENAETNADYTQVWDELSAFKNKKLNINTATIEELIAFPFFNASQAALIVKHRALFGNFLDLAELQVLGYEPEFIAFLSNYLSTSNTFNTGIKDILKNWDKGEGELSYTAINKGKLAVNNAVGSTWQEQIRFRYKKTNMYSLNLNIEKDAGEKWLYNNKPEFISAHFAIQNLGVIKNLIIGDFILQNGESLVMGSGIGIGKSAMVMNIKKQASYIRPYRGINEFFFQRGIAAEFGLHNWRLITSFAYNKLDAAISADTLGINESFTSIDLDGLHRTATELAKKGLLHRSITHAGVVNNNKYGSWGVSFNHFNYNIAQQYSSKLYQLFKPVGTNFSYLNLYQTHVIGNVLFFGEAAYLLQNQAKALALGMLTNLGEKIEFGLHYRNYSNGFYSSLATPFAASSNPEQGFYASAKITFSKKYQFSVYKDVFTNPWFTFTQLGLGVSNDLLAQLDIVPNKTSNAYVRVRSYQKFKTDKTTEFVTLNPINVLMLRLHYQTDISKSFKLETRAELNQSKQLNTTNNGSMIYLDFSKSFRFMSQRIAARYTLFNISDFYARIYAFEDQISYQYSVAGYYGSGSSAYLIYHIKPIKSLHLAMRLGHQITGVASHSINHKTSIYLQSIFKI